MGAGSTIFSTLPYGESIDHIGLPVVLEPLESFILVRDIPATNHRDAVGPWPYADMPSLAGLRRAVADCRASGLVSLVLIIRPDAVLPEVPEGLARIDTLKEHFILDPRLPPPTLGKRTRRNLSLASRHWDIEPLPPVRIAEVCLELQRLLAARRRLSTFAKVPDRHFARIAGVEGIEAMAAVDFEGPGAVLVAARRGGETHLLHLLTSPRGMRTCAAHLLMAEALARWAPEGCVYMGGAPDGEDGAGVAQFKARWANRTAPTHLVKIVLDPETYGRLSRPHAGTAFFPAYRCARP